jgi:hypothetical protein
MITGKPGFQAEVFPAAAAKMTPTTGGIKPGHAYSVTPAKKRNLFSQLFHRPDYLMPGNSWQVNLRKLSFYRMQVSMADAAVVNLHQYFSRPGHRNFNLLQPERSLLYRLKLS